MFQDLRAAFRSLAHRPAFTLVATGLLALGIGLTTAAFGVVDGLVLQTPPYDHPERIVVVSAANPALGLTGAALSYPSVADMREASRSLEAVSVVREQRALVSDGPRTERSTGVRVAPEFFRVFGITPTLGRSLLPGDDSPVAERSIVLSEHAWREWYARKPSAVGRVMTLDGIGYTIVGVMPAWFDFPTGADFWIPFVQGSAVVDRTSHYVSAVARLTPRASVEEARAELHAISDRLARAYPASDAGWDLQPTPIHEFLFGDTHSEAALAGLAAFVVLLISCANVASLLLARGAARQTETGVRRALGASNGQLVRAVLIESLLIAVAGAVVGAIGAQAVSGVLRQVVPGPLPAWVSFSVDLKTLGFVASVAAFSTVLAGIAPAMSAVGASPPDLLGGRATSSRHQRRLRRGIVVAQIALATMLLAGAGLLGESLLQLLQVQLGFNPTGVVTARVTLIGPRYSEPAASVRFYGDVLERLRALPGVQAAGAVDELPLASGTNRFAFTLDGEPRPPRGSEPIARGALITPGYFTALQIPVLRGRDIETRDDATHPRVALASASWVRQFSARRDPIGQQFRTPDATVVTTIIGTVGDVRHDGPETPGEPTMYLPLAQNATPEMTLVVRAVCDVGAGETCRNAALLAPATRRVVAEIDPGISAYAVETMSEVVNQALSSRRMGTALSIALAVLALGLASAGVYGLMELHAALSRREVGIRLALGAQPRQVRRRLLGEGLRLVAMGTVVGLALTALGGQLMANLLYGVTPTHLPALFIAGVFMVCIGVLASWAPAERSARVSPVIALRSE